jgi:hypothetical protein
VTLYVGGLSETEALSELTLDTHFIEVIGQRQFQHKSKTIFHS